MPGNHFSIPIMDSEIKKNILTIYNWLAITDKLEKAELIFLAQNQSLTFLLNI